MPHLKGVESVHLGKSLAENLIPAAFLCHAFVNEVRLGKRKLANRKAHLCKVLKA
jgi:hypothetical protein